MNNFILSSQTVQRLAAQVNLNGTFNHVCRAAMTGHTLSFRLIAERGTNSSTFTVETGIEKHSLTVDHRSKGIHQKLVDFIETIANGRMDSAETAPRAPARSKAPLTLLDSNQEQQLRDLVRRGGSFDVELGFEHPIKVAVHRTATRPGITAILTIGVSRPRTQCFTVHDNLQCTFNALVESIEHMAAAATPAAQAA